MPGCNSSLEEAANPDTRAHTQQQIPATSRMVVPKLLGVATTLRTKTQPYNLHSLEYSRLLIGFSQC